MGVFFIYMLKSAVCLAMFYLFYKALLSRETFHRFNRIALLGILALAFFLPAANIAVAEPTAINRTVWSMEDYWLMAQAESLTEAETESHGFGWKEGLVSIYFIGMAFFFLRNVYAIRRMYALIRRSRVTQMPDGNCLVIHRENQSPFSWMHYIVLSEKDASENARAIITHEQAHIRYRHSWDLLLAEACIGLQWFNPAAWLMKRELQNIHEYEADEAVLASGFNAKEYQLLLIKKAVGSRLYSLANSLNHSSLKKRITMMMKKKSNPWARAKYLYVLPLAAVAVAAFARPEISRSLNEISSFKITDLSVIHKGNSVKSSETEKSTVKVTGSVCDDKNEPIVGAIIVDKSSKKGTVSDPEGQFTLEVPSGTQLQVIYSGYQTESVQAEEGKTLKVIQQKDNGNGTATNSLKGKPQTIKIVGHQDKTGNEKEPYAVVDQMPQFPGGPSELMKYITANLRYPEDAKQANSSGRVIAQFTVEEDGSITDIEIKRSVSPSMDQEALRVLSGMPKWQPGMQNGKAVPVKYTVPIVFHNDKNNPDSTNVSFSQNQLLIILDGKEYTGDINQIDPSTIEKVEVIKDPAATAPYGDKAKNGIIRITTKKN